MPENISSQFHRLYPAPIEDNRVVETILERDSIPGNVRWEGMHVYVSQEGEKKTYELRGGITNDFWEPISDIDIDVAVDIAFSETSTNPVQNQVITNGMYQRTQLQTSGQAQVHWDNLTNVPDLVEESELSNYQLRSEKGQANGYVPLGSNQLIPSQYLPPLAITHTFVVASQSEMLALDAQTGDVAVRTDINNSFILQSEPASLLGNWVELLTPGAPVQSVNGETGTVQLDPSFSGGQFSITGSSSVNLDSRYYTETEIDGLLDDKIDDALESITDLINYSGEGNIVFVSDSLRGGVFFYRNTGTANDGTIFEATGKGAGYWHRDYEKKNGVNVEWFGADPTYTNESHDQINNAISVADSIGVRIVNFYPNGHYKILKQINGIPGISLIGEGVKFDARGAVASILSQTTPTSNFPQFSILHIDGQHQLIGQLANDALSTENTIRLSAPPSIPLEQNDVIVIQDLEDGSYYPGASQIYWRQGQFSTVRSLDNTGTEIDITVPIIPDIIPASTGYVYKINNKPFTIKGIEFVANYDNPEMTERIQSAVRIVWCSNYTIDTLKAANFPVDNLNISGSFNAEVKNCTLNKPEANPSQYNLNYGMNIGNSQSLYIHDNTVYAEFHAFTMGNTIYREWNGTEYVDTKVRPVNRYNRIVNNTISGPNDRGGSAAYDHHLNSEYNTVEGNTITGIVNMQSLGDKFINNYVQLSTSISNTQPLFNFDGYKRSDIEIKGNVFSSPEALNFFRFRLNADNISGTIRILDNTVDLPVNYSSNFMYFEESLGSGMQGVNLVLEGNRIEVDSPSTEYVDIFYNNPGPIKTQLVSIKDNSFKNIRVRVLNVVDFIYTNNYTDGSSHEAIRVIQAETSIIENNFTKNTNYSAGTGADNAIYVINNVTTSYVDGNIGQPGINTSFGLYYNATSEAREGKNIFPNDNEYVSTSNVLSYDGYNSLRYLQGYSEADTQLLGHNSNVSEFEWKNTSELAGFGLSWNNTTNQFDWGTSIDAGSGITLREIDYGDKNYLFFGNSTVTTPSDDLIGGMYIARNSDQNASYFQVQNKNENYNTTFRIESGNPDAFASIQLTDNTSDLGGLIMSSSTGVELYARSVGGSSGDVDISGSDAVQLRSLNGIVYVTGQNEARVTSQGDITLTAVSGIVEIPSSDLKIGTNNPGTQGVILRSPDGTNWKITVDNSGTLTTTALP